MITALIIYLVISAAVVALILSSTQSPRNPHDQ